MTHSRTRGTFNSSASPKAISKLWLHPRIHTIAGCRGSGITPSTYANSEPTTRTILRHRTRPNQRLPQNFRAYIASRNGALNAPHTISASWYLARRKPNAACRPILSKNCDYEPSKSISWEQKIQRGG